MLYSKGRILTLSIKRSNELMLDEYDQEKRHMGTSWSQGEEETTPSMSTQSIDQTKLLQPSQIHENKSSATNNAVEKSSTSDHQLKQLHHNSHQILEDASSKSNTNSSDSNSNGNSKSNSNGSFVLPARKLSITWSENDRYWKWTSLNETSDKMVEVAELKAVCWLEVHGKFQTRNLTPGICYQVAFEIMMTDRAQGWDVPVNVTLILPGGIKQQRKENLKEKPRVKWIEILVGEFVAPAQDNGGEIEFSLYEYEGGRWKNGLLFKGVSIRPKN